MKLSVFADSYSSKALDETLSKMKKLGIDTVELGSGGYSGKNQCDPAVLLTDKNAFYKFRESFNKYSIDICALAAHGNPVHPDRETAHGFDSDFKNAVILAERLEIDTVVTYSGCPGDCEEAKYPNWIGTPWPDDYLKVLDWQWNEVLLPYWHSAAAFAREHGVTRIAVEMRPGFCVYNPETMLRLRRDVGDTVGACFNPAELAWQGIDPVYALRSLKGAVYHVRAKDVKTDKYNTAENGVFDTKHFSDGLNRAWSYRTVGYGSDASYWKNIICALRQNGYDRVLSLSHEDKLMTADEGLKKAVEFLRPLMIEEPSPEAIDWQ